MLRALSLLTISALLLALSCTQSEDDACGDEQVYDDGSCRPKPAAAAGTGNGAGGNPAEGGAGGAPDEVDPSFGTSCEESADCTDATDYCAISPAAPPYCTASGCDADETICPEGWTCFDVSQFAPGEPWICAQP